MNLKNILFNFLGLGVPLLFAIWAVPVLIHNIGLEKFGFVGLAWGLVGSASILDLGMSRAITQRLASNRDTVREIDAQSIIKSGAYVTAVLGLIAFAVLASLAFFGVADLLEYSDTTDFELRVSIILLAFTLPLQAFGLLFKGVSEAYLSFRGISIVRILLGVANFVIPAILSFHTTDLHLLVMTLLIARLLSLGAYLYLSRAAMPERVRESAGAFDLNLARELFSFGKWVALSGVIQPVLAQSDRFIIVAVLSASAVGEYVIAYEIPMQSVIIAGAVTTVAFPVISKLLVSDPETAFVVINRWASVITVLMTTVLGLIALAMPLLLEAWLGKFATEDSIAAGRILCIGALAFSIGTIYTSFLHAKGQSKLTALVQLAETPVYLVALFFAISHFGIVGAAAASGIRAICDTGLLILAARRMAR